MALAPIVYITGVRFGAEPLAVTCIAQPTGASIVQIMATSH